jgi:hypothetical protein
MWFRVRMTQRSCKVSDNAETEMKIASTLNGTRGVAVDSDERVQHRIGEVIAQAFLTVGRRTAFALAPAALVLTLGCSVLIEPDRKQCSTNDDCTGRGPEFVGTVCGASGMCEDPWKCLDQPPPPAVPVDERPPSYYITVHAQNIVNQSPVTNAEVKLCRKLDPTCDKPESQGTTDSNGDVTLQIASNVTTAYFSVKKFVEGEINEQWVPAYYYFNPNITGDMTVSVQMATFDLRGKLIFVLQVPQEDTRGLMLINAFNCAGTAAPGIVFTADKQDEATTPFYVVSGVPNITRTSTNTDGYGGFINIPVGETGNGDTVTVTATVELTGRVMNTNALHVRPNAITYSRMVPSGQPSTQ